MENKKVNKRLGRPTLITQELINNVKLLKENRKPIVFIASTCNVSRSTIYKILKEELGYTSTFNIKPPKRSKK